MLTKEDLQAIAAIMDDKITASEGRTANKIDSAIAASEERTANKIDSAIAASEKSTAIKLDKMADDIAEIKENTEITRDAVNSLIEWTDKTSKIVDVPFMKEAK